MGELKALHPLAPFYGGVLAESRETAAGDERAFRLFEAALDCPSPPARDAAARKLLDLLLKNPDRRRAEELRKLLGKKKPDPEAGSSLGALFDAVRYILGGFDQLLREHGPEKSRTPEKDKPPGGTRFPGETSSPWEEAFYLAAALQTGTGSPGETAGTEGFTRDLLDFFLGQPPGAAYHWIYRILEGLEQSPFTQAESAAVAGRLAVFRYAYNEGLEWFRTVLDQDESLFFRYPELLSELGRAFQYGSAPQEGAALFANWAGRPEIQDGKSIPAVRGESLNPEETLRDFRYRLLFFSGRIERQRERYPEAVELFTQALSLAPDSLQEDACIWYILSINLMRQPETAARLLGDYAPLWHDPAYFGDILDQLSRNLTVRRWWTVMAEAFPRIRPWADRATVAKYAYILGRAVSEGYLSEAEAAAALPGAAASGTYGAGGLGNVFFNIAFEEGSGSFYYRALAASRLGQRGSPIPGKEETAAEEPAPPSGGTLKPVPAADFPHPPDMEFLLGFFTFGAGTFAYPYIQTRAAQLTIPELRVLAQAYQDTGYWGESIRIVSAYMGREEYEITRADMELCYPRPFKDLTEGYARETGVPIEILYGLIRTESYFIPDISSRVGAIGLTQLMPSTAREMAGRLSRGGGPDYIENDALDLRDPGINIHLGSFYLNYLMDHLQPPLLALLAYNGGMGRVRRWRAAEPELPPDLFLETIELQETRDYGRKVLGAAAAYGYLYYNMTMEGVIADTLM
jgi:soluble lytic murein transglycosylase